MKCYIISILNLKNHAEVYLDNILIHENYLKSHQAVLDQVYKNLGQNVTYRRRRLKRYPLQVRHKQDWDRGFILLLP